MSGRNFGTNKDVKKLIRQARRAGWEVTMDGGQHIKVKPPHQIPFRIPLTTANQARLRGIRGQFKKAGLPQ